MLYSEKYNLLFIAVPKTGTTSFTSTLSETLETERNVVCVNGSSFVCGEHDTLLQIAERVVWDSVKNMTVVGAVRNPWDRLVSSYHFYRNGRVFKLVSAGKQKNLKAIINVIAARFLPFSIWLRLYRTKSCLSYLVDTKGDLAVNYVLRLEAFSEDIRSLCEKIGIPETELTHQNKSSRSNYQSYYTDSTRKLVERMFKDDIETFGYRF